MPDTFASPKSIWGRCLLGVRSHLHAVNIEGIPTASAVIQKLPHNLAQLKPGMFISPAKDELTGRGNASDTWRFLTQVTWVQVTNGLIDNFEAIDAWLLGRERLWREMLPTFGGILNGIEFAHNLEILPGPVFDTASFVGGHDAQAFIVAISTAIPRKRPTS